MTAWILGVLGVLVGAGLSRWLATHAYRYDDETDTPARVPWRWLPAALAVALFAVGHVLAPRPWIVVATYALAVVMFGLLTAVDLDVHRLPDKVTLPAAPVFAVLLAGCSWATGDWGAWVEALLTGAGLFIAYFLLAILSPGGAGLGFGDVKLSLTIGLLLGWFAWSLAVVATFLAFVLGGLLGLVLILTRRAGRKSYIAFGPPMMLAVVLTIVLPDLLSGPLL